jgi:hypothetical protein
MIRRKQNEGHPPYRRDLDAGPPQLKKKFGRVWDAVDRHSLNRCEVFRLIRLGLIKSFVYKANPAGKSGIRLVDMDSLDAYMDGVAAQAMAEQEGGK